MEIMKDLVLVILSFNALVLIQSADVITASSPYASVNYANRKGRKYDAPSDRVVLYYATGWNVIPTHSVKKSDSPRRISENPQEDSFSFLGNASVTSSTPPLLPEEDPEESTFVPLETSPTTATQVDPTTETPFDLTIENPVDSTTVTIFYAEGLQTSNAEHATPYTDRLTTAAPQIQENNQSDISYVPSTRKYDAPGINYVTPWYVSRALDKIY